MKKKPQVLPPTETPTAPQTRLTVGWRIVGPHTVAIGPCVELSASQRNQLADLYLSRADAELFARWVLAAWAQPPATPPAK